MKKFKVECPAHRAGVFSDWIATRGGIALWKSMNLSNPGASWCTPACNIDGTPTEKPTWQCTNRPEIVTDAADVGVYTPKLFKAFEVALRRTGMAFRLTDRSQRKVDKAMAECEEAHGDAYYERDVLHNEGASIGIYYTDDIRPLSEVRP